ncbi:MAG: hypothetical protein U9P88_01380 [Patescibacteria group bacterium]|nr:hypothetical protein [Patescibacteria group bacterium]
MKKIRNFFGWVLLLVGLSIIICSLYSSYNIFTAKTDPPKIFKMTDSSEINNETQKTITNKEDEQMKEMMRQQIKEFIPPSSIPKSLNLIAWSVFVGILILGGGKISFLGIKLIKL